MLKWDKSSKPGTRITIIEASERVLMPVDAILAERLAKIMRSDGIVLHTGAKVTHIRQDATGLSVQFVNAQDKTVSANGEKVLVVIGRHPHVDGLGLKNTDVAYDQHGVKVGPTLETDEPGIFATGDVVGAPMFAHWATAQALAVARHILGMPTSFPNSDHNSAVIFGFPEIGMVGLTEQAARERGIEVDTIEYDYHIDARAQISGDSEGLLRIVYKKNH